MRLLADLPSSTDGVTKRAWSELKRVLDTLIAPSVGPQGPPGRDGAPGVNGTNGMNGTNGAGVPFGGAFGTYLAKASGESFDTRWVEFPIHFMDGELPTGSIDGANKLFLLSFQPWPAYSLILVQRMTEQGGLTLVQGLDYTLGGTSTVAIDTLQIISPNTARVFTKTPHGYSIFDNILFSDVVGVPQLNTGGLVIQVNLTPGPTEFWASLPPISHGMPVIWSNYGPAPDTGTVSNITSYSGNVISMTEAPDPGDTLHAWYRY